MKARAGFWSGLPGTEPKIQVWVWGDDAALADKVNGEISAVLAKAPGYESVKVMP